MPSSSTMSYPFSRQDYYERICRERHVNVLSQKGSLEYKVSIIAHCYILAQVQTMMMVNNGLKSFP